MLNITQCVDPEECAMLWRRLWPARNFFDLWEVRSCFAESFGSSPRFLVARDGRELVGFLALNSAEDGGGYNFYPGETWMGKTWLEQNRIPAATAGVRDALIGSLEGSAHLRYIEPEYVVGSRTNYETDEIKYLFMPGNYGYSYDNYYSSFSRKSQKGFQRLEESFSRHGLRVGPGTLKDLDIMFRMNLDAFGPMSYFHDKRFLRAFESLARLLWDSGALTITTVTVGSAVAAVDMGALYGGCHTVLAGGTNNEFIGIAKVINLHHIRTACAQGIESVDFLCGDFGWKERFHLSARPLYKIDTTPHAGSAIDSQYAGSTANAAI